VPHTKDRITINNYALILVAREIYFLMLSSSYLQNCCSAIYLQQNSRQAVPSVSGTNCFFSAYATTRGSCPLRGKNRGKNQT
jgi:hypothetical protein